MKKILVLFLFLAQLFVFAQKIDESKIDDFTGEKVIYTSWEKIKGGNGITGKDNLSVKFRYENKLIFLHLKWVTNNHQYISEDATIIFKLSNNKMVTLKAVADVKSRKGAGATGLQMSGVEGIDPIYIGDLDLFLGDACATKLRINTANGYVDIDLKEKDTAKINKLYNLLIDEVNK